MKQELALLLDYAIATGRITDAARAPIESWYDTAHHLMAEYQHGAHDPQEFELHTLNASRAALYEKLGKGVSTLPT